MSNALSCICYPSSSVTKAAYTFCFRLLFSRAYFSGRDNNNSMHSPTNLLSSPLAHSHQFLSLSPSHTHARARTRAHTHTPLIPSLHTCLPPLFTPLILDFPLSPTQKKSQSTQEMIESDKRSEEI